MRILLWHGYLLSGTGSNIYARAVAREWSWAGHEVVVVCQEPHPEQFDLGGATVVRPELPEGLLPVFVLDRYEGLEPKLLTEWTPQERARYVDANAAALRELLPADLVFADHVLMGGPVAAATEARHAVYAHGSELEYSIRGNAELAAWARDSLAGAAAVFVGSRHIREVLEEVVGTVDRVHEVPPGVDVENFRPQPRDRALAALLAECRRDPPNPGNAEERLPYEGNAQRLEEFFRLPGPIVVYVGKLLYNKGVHVLFEAMRGLDARGVIVGFGDYREELEALAPPNVLFTGALEHRHLVHLLAVDGRGGRSLDIPGGLRHGCGRGGRGRRPAARRPPLGPGRDRGGAGGRLSVALPSPRVLRKRKRRRPRPEARGAACASLARAARARAPGAGDGRRAVVVGQRRAQTAGTVRLVSAAWGTRSA